MSWSRREFVAGVSALGVAGGTEVFAAGEKPVWTAGIMTDTHVQTRRKDTSLVRKACELFARRKVDLVVNCGDICETYDPRGYAAIRKVYDEVFAGLRPQEIWVYAYHEWVRRLKEPHDTVMADVQKHLKAKNGPYASMTLRGYPIVVVPQITWETAKVEEMISAAEKAHPDPRIPVFVFDHEAGWNTNDATITWGTYDRLELYSRHPRVILVSGHAHSSLRSELNCWLGGYASINAGCLDKWRGDAAAATYVGKPEYGVLIMEVYRSRVVFRRFDVRDGSEYSPDAPWTVALPYKPSEDPFARLRNDGGAGIPQFPGGAALSVGFDGDPAGKVTLKFPAASVDKDYLYRIDISDDKGVRLGCREEYGQFYLGDAEKSSVITLAVPAGYFEPGKRYGLSVTPCDCLRRSGRPISAEFVMRGRTGETVWDCADPMTACRFLSGRTGSSPVPLKDGYYGMSVRDNRLVLPENIWDGAKGTRFRLTVDLEMKSSRVWAFVLCNAEKYRPVNPRIYSPREKKFRQRVVIEFAKPTDGFRGVFVVKEGGRGEVRFLRVRLERGC